MGGNIAIVSMGLSQRMAMRNDLVQRPSYHRVEGHGQTGWWFALWISHFLKWRVWHNFVETLWGHHLPQRATGSELGDTVVILPSPWSGCVAFLGVSVLIYKVRGWTVLFLKTLSVSIVHDLWWDLVWFPPHALSFSSDPEDNIQINLNLLKFATGLPWLAAILLFSSLVLFSFC